MFFVVAPVVVAGAVPWLLRRWCRRPTFLQNLRRGRYELAIDLPAPLRIAAAFTEPARTI
jgi:hypothetical protein